MSYDLKNEEEVRQYLSNLGTEYRFGCFKERKPEVCHLLGDYLEAISKDFKKAFKVYKSNCDEWNFPRSCFKTANYILAGKGGADKSVDQSLKYFDKGCDLKDYDSCFRSGYLSVLNSKSPSPTRSFVQGVNQLKKSCDGNHAEACHHLSSIYMDGNETPGNDYICKDMTKAFEFAMKACDLGNIYACVNVSIMYNKGEGVAKDQAQSERYKQLALEKKKEYERDRSLTFQEGLKPA